jgi:hypothetical protein
MLQPLPADVLLRLHRSMDAIFTFNRHASIYS